MSDAEPALIRADALRKEFDGTVAVAGLSLRVAPGEVYGLIGPNGAGKTTSLRMIAGLLSPTAGGVRVGGVDVVADPVTARGRVGYLTGTTGLYERLTVAELVGYFARLHGLARAAAAARLAALAAALDLSHLLERRCARLSTGERQRASFARALVHDPPVLILDEPTAGLDVVASRFARELVARERARGKAILFSTHYMTEAELLCDRVGFLHRGELRAEGTPAELKARAATATLEEAFLSLLGLDPRPAPVDREVPA